MSTIKRILKQPMLAPHIPPEVPIELSVEDYVRKYMKMPCMLSPKIDGIRCLVDTNTGECWSRSFKPIPNVFIRRKFKEIKWPMADVILDGELVCLDDNRKARAFHTTQSFVRSEVPTEMQRWQYLVFDCIVNGNVFQYAKNRYMYAREATPVCAEVKLICHYEVPTLELILEAEQNSLLLGHEGVMLRACNSPYKHKSRCTLDQGYLLKVVRTVDEQAKIVGFEEQMTCTAESLPTETGNLKKFKRKDNVEPTGMLGAFWCEDERGRFKVAAGQLSWAERRMIWSNKESFAGRILIHRHKPHGRLELPRQSRFVEFKNKLSLI